MPRLRKLKNYNFVIGEPLIPREDDSDSDIQQSGEHWLSNNRVIASLAADEIEQAIKFHRLQIATLQEELDARASGLRKREFFAEASLRTRSYHPLLDSLYEERIAIAISKRAERSGRAKKAKAKLSKKEKLALLASKLAELGFKIEDLERLKHG